jgi:hypothetical protein
MESQRRRRRNYHDSHINHVSADGLEKLLRSNGFIIVDHCVYPMVGAPIRDIVLKFFAQSGDHQCIAAVKQQILS